MLWSASGAMAGDAVIAASNAASTRPETWRLALLAAWAAVGLSLAWRRGWLQGARTVRWRLHLLDDQVLIACGVLLSGLLATLVASALGAKPGDTPSTGISLAALVTSCATTIVAWQALERAHAATAERAPGGWTVRAAMVGGILGLAIAWPVVALVSHLGSAIQQRLGGPAVPEVAHDTLVMLRTHASEPSAWLLALAVVTLTPVAEELLWRGAVQQALKAAGLPRLVAVACASALFALVHWNAVPAEARIGALPALAALGFTFGWLMERCGRIAAPMAAHAAFNAANLLLFSMLPG